MKTIEKKYKPSTVKDQAHNKSTPPCEAIGDDLEGAKQAGLRYPPYDAVFS